MRQLRFLACLLAVLVVLSSAQVFAAGSIDLTREPTLTLNCWDGRTPISGAKFSIYLVATVDANGELAVTDEFKAFNVDIRGENDEAWRLIASTLEGYVIRDRITPTDSGKTDEKGQLKFPTKFNKAGKLTPGLYLVAGGIHAQNGYYYDPGSFMVLLPTQDKVENEWVYDVAVSPKFDRDKIPTGSEKETITRKVLKVWNDKGHENIRPKEIVVELYCDDVLYDTVKLNTANNWRHTWTNLEKGHKWTIVEDTPGNYTVTAGQEGITCVITNTYVEDETKPTPTTTPRPSYSGGTTTPRPSSSGGSSGGSSGSSGSSGGSSHKTIPQTGQLWWPVPIFLCAGLTFIIIGLLRRRGTENEE